MLDRRVGELSGGEAVLTAIAGIRLRGAGVTLLDEPTNNLDRLARARLAEMVRGWRGALIVVSHDLTPARAHGRHRRAVRERAVGVRRTVLAVAGPAGCRAGRRPAGRARRGAGREAREARPDRGRGEDRQAQGDGAQGADREARSGDRRGRSQALRPGVGGQDAHRDARSRERPRGRRWMRRSGACATTTRSGSICPTRGFRPGAASRRSATARTRGRSRVPSASRSSGRTGSARPRCWRGWSGTATCRIQAGCARPR